MVCHGLQGSPVAEVPTLLLQVGDSDLNGVPVDHRNEIIPQVGSGDVINLVVHTAVVEPRQTTIVQLALTHPACCLVPVDITPVHRLTDTGEFLPHPLWEDGPRGVVLT